jgi:hypothetical protein
MTKTRHAGARARTNARPRAARPSFVKRHPLLTVGAIAAGLGGAYALLGRRNGASRARRDRD